MSNGASDGSGPAAPAPRARTTWARRLRRFFTTLPGFMTGLAAVVTATATIVATLHGSSGNSGNSGGNGGGSSSGSGGGTASGSTGAAGSTPSAGTTVPTPAAPRIQWGPGAMLITNNGTDLGTIPPNDDALPGDVYDGGQLSGVGQSTKLALWPNTGSPSPQQCLSLDQTQAVTGDLSVHPGSIVCVETASGLIAIIHVTAVDDGSLVIHTETTVWIMPGI